MQVDSIRRSVRLGTIRLMSNLFPEHFGAIGARHFLQPRPIRREVRWPQVFDGFERRTLDVQGEQIPLWVKGTGPRVLLVHGWESDHYSMGGFVEPLLAQGYGIATLDLPAHGLATGRRAPLPLMAKAIAAVGAEVGSLHAVIAHSIGGAMSVLAMEEYGLKAARLALIGAPQAARHQAFLQGRSSGLSERALGRMADQIQAALGAPLERFRTDRGLAGLGISIMLIHAEDDAVVSIEAARRNAAACQAKTLWLKQGGHNRPLGDPRVIQAITGFLKTGNRRNRHPAALRHHPGLQSQADDCTDRPVERSAGGSTC